MPGPRDYLNSDIKRLFALSGNQCSEPECERPLIAEDGVTVVGKICHITAASSNGPRYNKRMTNEERRSFDNLILLCDEHHSIIDNKKNELKFNKETIVAWKKKHIEGHKENKIEVSDEVVVTAINGLEKSIDNIEDNTEEILDRIKEIQSDESESDSATTDDANFYNDVSIDIIPIENFEIARSKRKKRKRDYYTLIGAVILVCLLLVIFSLVNDQNSLYTMVGFLPLGLIKWIKDKLDGIEDSLSLLKMLENEIKDFLLRISTPPVPENADEMAINLKQQFWDIVK